MFRFASRGGNSLNRGGGGLWFIKPDFQEILVYVELNFRRFMSVHRRIANIDEFVNGNMQANTVQNLYDSICFDIHCTDENRKISLQSILELFAKVRMFSFAKKKREKAILKQNAKKKSLRTELKRYENAMEMEIPE